MYIYIIKRIMENTRSDFCKSFLYVFWKTYWKKRKHPFQSSDYWFRVRTSIMVLYLWFTHISFRSWYNASIGFIKIIQKKMLMRNRVIIVENNYAIMNTLGNCYIVFQKFIQDGFVLKFKKKVFSIFML